MAAAISVLPFPRGTPQSAWVWTRSPFLVSNSSVSQSVWNSRKSSPQ